MLEVTDLKKSFVSPEGTPVDIEVQMQSASILSQTLLLFGGTIVAAALTMGGIIWWVVRRGRGADAAHT